MKKFLIVTVVLLIPTVFVGYNVKADCANGRCNVLQQQVISEQVTTQLVPIATPVPFTVAVPVVSYLFNGGGFTPIYQANPATPATGMQVQQPQQPQGFQLTDAQIARIVDQLILRLGKQPLSAPPAVPNTLRSQQPTITPQTLDAEVISVLQKPRGLNNVSCGSCHTGPGAKAGIMIFSSPSVLNLAAPWFRIWDVTDTGVMPPEARSNKNAALTDQEMLVLRSKLRLVETGK